MAVNRGKQFEDVVREAFEKVEGVSIDRLHDQTNGFRGSQNICDFIVYKYPHQYYIECKSVHGAYIAYLSLTNTDSYTDFMATSLILSGRAYQQSLRLTE